MLKGLRVSVPLHVALARDSNANAHSSKGISAFLRLRFFCVLMLMHAALRERGPEGVLLTGRCT